MEGSGVHGAFSRSTRSINGDGLAFEEEVDEKERTLNDVHRNVLMLLLAASYKKKSSVKAVQSTNGFGHYDNAAAQEHSNRLSESLKPIPTESLSRPNKEENPKTQSYNETVSSTHKERGNQLEPKCSKEVQTDEWLYPTAKTHESTPCYLAGPSKSKYLVLAVVIVLLFGMVACINTPANERMHEEWHRLETFSLYRGNGNGINLAKNGFYSNGTPTRTFCFACNLMVSDWQYYDDTEHVHRIRSPNCPMHDHSFSQNIPIERTANHIDHAGSAHSHGSVARSNRIQRSNVQDEQRSGHDAVGALHGVLRANHGASTDMHGTERAEPTRQGADRAPHGAEPTRQDADRASHGAEPTRQDADRASHGAEPTRQDGDIAGADMTEIGLDTASQRIGGHGGRSGRNVNQPSLAWLLQYLQQRRTVPQYDEVNYEQLFLPQPNLPSHPVHRTPYYTELGVTLRTEADDSSRSRGRCTILNAQGQQLDEGASSSSQAADLQDGCDDPPEKK